MNRAYRFTVVGVMTMLLSGPFSHAAFDLENRSIVSNGQGVSSPSFSGGLSGENPAGLISNESFKVFGTLARFEEGAGGNLRPAAGFLIGNGVFGAGAQFTRFNEFPTADGQGEIDWALGGRFGMISLGVSGQHTTVVDDPTLNIGVMIEYSAFRLGIMVLPRFGRGEGISVFAAGITTAIRPQFDLVIDSAFDRDFANGSLKPGISFHTSAFQLTGAYGFRLIGTSNIYLKKNFTFGAGVPIGTHFLLGYEYRGLPEHALTLNVRL
jgi:hypothetical protein